MILGKIELLKKYNIFKYLLIVVIVLPIYYCFTGFSYHKMNSQFNESTINITGLNGEAHLKIATYNIRINGKNDKKTGNGWKKRKKYIAMIIKKNNIDIFGKQEGYSYQLSDLMKLLPKYDYVNSFYGGNLGLSGTASIIFKKSEFKLLDQGRFWYSETPNVRSIGWDATDTRVCTWAKLKVKSNGQEFYFFTSHFAWKPDRNHGQIAEKQSGKLMIKEIKKVNTEDLPVIATGDLNSKPMTSQIKYIEKYLNDARKISEAPPEGPVDTAMQGGHFQEKPRARIDYIFVNNLVKVKTYSAVDFTYNDGRYPSDHLPIICNVILKRHR